MLKVALTGSIGTGKSTTAKMFSDEGIPIFDADRTVHELYAGRAAPLIEAAFPGTTADGSVDRDRLSKAVLGNPEALKKLEEIVHPLVHEEETVFIEHAQADGHDLAIFEIPLLFETGGEERFDAVVATVCDEDIQRERVLARPGMTEEKLSSILSRQFPMHLKKSRANFVVDTTYGLESARNQVAKVTMELRNMRRTSI